MAVKTFFSQDDFRKILSHYALGAYIRSEPAAQGTVQTNYFVDTTQGKFVFRAYENRSMKSVLFECHLLTYLREQNYPCPAPLMNSRGKHAGLYHQKPYAIFEFMPGQPIDQPNEHHQEQLIQKAAELQNLTRHYRPRYQRYRWNYSIDLCQKLATIEATKLNTKDAKDKAAWIEQQLASLDLPHSLPKGICHCDFHFSNVLFQGDEFAALLDFDDANYTYLLFDLVGLIGSSAWPHPSDTLNLTAAQKIVQKYAKYRPLRPIEQHHLYDVYQLSTLFDCIWYFGRGGAEDFYEKRKVDFLNDLGRERFFEAIFLPSGS